MVDLVNNGEKYIPLLETELGVAKLVLLHEKPLVHGNIIYSGELNGKKCAVKFSVNDPDSVRCEYECAKRLFSEMTDHVVKPLLFKVVERGAAYVSEWIEGALLHKYLAANKVAPEQFDSIIMQLDEITDYFLSVRFAHRDFSPCNIIVDMSGTLKVIDFQNSGFVGEKDLSAKKSFREIRSYVYSYRTLGYGAGTFNDRVHFLYRVRSNSALQEALRQRWETRIADSSLHFKVGCLRMVYMFGNLPMLLLKNIFESKKTKRSKIAKKLDTTFNTVRDFMTGRNW